MKICAFAPVPDARLKTNSVDANIRCLIIANAPHYPVIPKLPAEDGKSE